MCMIADYSTLLQQKAAIETALISSPQEYVLHKVINGKVNSHLQKKVNGTVSNTLVMTDQETIMAEALEKRKQQEETLLNLNSQIIRLEEKAECTDKSVFRRMMLVKLSMNMDSIDSMQKDKSISFANAMNAIEGTPVSKKLEGDLRQWKSGELSFLTLFERTLKRYGFPVLTSE